MTDTVKKAMQRRCGPGGFKCACCNDYHGKSRKVLGRIVRRTEAMKLRKALKAL